MTEKGISLIKEFEGFYKKAYLCPAGVPTIGYGTTSIGDIPVVIGMEINEVVADALLRADLAAIEKYVDPLVKIELSPYQLDALVSFEYNTGGLARSTLLKKINAGEPITSYLFTMWNKAHVDGELVELEGLTRRRLAEYELYSYDH